MNKVLGAVMAAAMMMGCGSTMPPVTGKTADQVQAAVTQCEFMYPQYRRAKRRECINQALNAQR